MEIQPDSLDREIAKHAVRLAGVVEVRLHDDPRAFVDLGQFLVGEPEGVELATAAPRERSYTELTKS